MKHTQTTTMWNMTMKSEWSTSTSMRSEQKTNCIVCWSRTKNDNINGGCFLSYSLHTNCKQRTVSRVSDCRLSRESLLISATNTESQWLCNEYAKQSSRRNGQKSLYFHHKEVETRSNDEPSRWYRRSLSDFVSIIWKTNEPKTTLTWFRSSCSIQQRTNIGLNTCKSCISSTRLLLVCRLCMMHVKTPCMWLECTWINPRCCSSTSCCCLVMPKSVIVSMHWCRMSMICALGIWMKIWTESKIESEGMKSWVLQIWKEVTRHHRVLPFRWVHRRTHQHHGKEAIPGSICISTLYISIYFVCTFSF